MRILIYRISIFGNFTPFEPTTDNILKWTYELKKLGYNFLPSVLPINNQDIYLQFFSGGQMIEEKRLQFVSPDDNMTVRILSNRLDIEFSNLDVENIKNDFDEKCNYASNIMETILPILGDINGNRLAYFTDIVDPYINDTVFLDFYKKNNLGINIENAVDDYVEWAHKFNRRTFINIDNNESELCNTILYTETGELKIAQNDQTIKGLRIQIDINTLAENLQDRFSVKSLRPFFYGAQKLYFNIYDQLKPGLLE